MVILVVLVLPSSVILVVISISVRGIVFNVVSIVVIGAGSMVMFAIRTLLHDIAGIEYHCAVPLATPPEVLLMSCLQSVSSYGPFLPANIVMVSPLEFSIKVNLPWLSKTGTVMSPIVLDLNHCNTESILRLDKLLLYSTFAGADADPCNSILTFPF